MVVRSDKHLDRSFRTSDRWGTQQLGPRSVNLVALTRGGGNDSGRSSHSFSGNERNHLFLNRGGETYCDVSTVTELDSPKDTRAFVVWDYDRDGWQDVVYVNANAPLLEVHRNVIGTQEPAADRGHLGVVFVGGNRSAGPSDAFGPRDGFGARVTVDLGDLSLLREHRAGEGFAAQNGPTMLIGLGAHDAARAVTVRWPSGAARTATDVPSGTLLVAYEDPAESPDGSGFARRPYANLRERAAPIEAATAAPARTEGSPGLRLDLVDEDGAPSRLNLYVTMATWCVACKKHLPQVAELRERFGEEELGVLGVPFDPGEGDDLLDAYLAENEPAYRLLRGLRPEDRARVREILVTTIKTDALPSSIVTDAEGRVLAAFPGVPSVSDLRRLRAR